MKSLEVSGYLVVVLDSIPECSWDDLQKLDELDLADEYSFYSGNIKFPVNINGIFYKEDLPNSYPAWTRRMNRLSQLHSHCYKYTIHCTKETLSTIVQKTKSQKAIRILVFQSEDMISDFSELLKILRLNSFLYQRISYPRRIDEAFFRTGFISQKKLKLILEKKARSVHSSTFQILKLVLDRDFANNVDRIPFSQNSDIKKIISL